MIAACKRHKWKWLKNVIVRTERGFMVHIMKRGRYECEKCGKRRIGVVKPEVQP
ncbi:hypothetical protein FHW84_001774 [Dyella sp. SG562]|nr:MULTISPECIES: hypothetical protein [unclassified Dyella]NII73205.1 hypothetical protein [Dyella sp. SG562]NKJ21968.1 hypothetical protein [Dyella sp. SG609]